MLMLAITITTSAGTSTSIANIVFPSDIVKSFGE